MLDINLIRENKDVVEMVLKIKKMRKPVSLDELIRLADERKMISEMRDSLKKDLENITSLSPEEKTRKETELSKITENLKEIEKKYVSIMLSIPNMSSPDTPVGDNESQNREFRSFGNAFVTPRKPKTFDVVAKSLGLFSDEIAGKVSTADSAFLIGDLALLSNALSQYVIDVLTSRAKIEDVIKKNNFDINPREFVPVASLPTVTLPMLNRVSKLEPKDEKIMLDENLALATEPSESMPAIYMDKTLEEDALPVRLLGIAGNTTTKKISETGQTIKTYSEIIQMQTFCLPEYSIQEQDFLLAMEEYILQNLNIPYRVVLIASGLMDFSSYREVEIQAWKASVGEFVTISVAKLSTSFQSRRLNTKVNRIDGDSDFVHINSATALVGRELLKIIVEIWTGKDGVVSIPPVLTKYVKERKFLRKSLLPN